MWYDEEQRHGRNKVMIYDSESHMQLPYPQNPPNPIRLRIVDWSIKMRSS